jgi:hypothetical protein
MEFSERFPLNAIIICHAFMGNGRKGRLGSDAYLLGALTSATRFSKACWRGDAVDAEEFCNSTMMVNTHDHR